LPAAFPQGRLEAHLEAWTKDIADVRLHGTTGEAPIMRFPARAGGGSFGLFTET
jgi:hypothetical protein